MSGTEKEDLSKYTQTAFFEYLVDKQINKGVISYLKGHKWMLSAAGIIVAIILAVLGINVKQIMNELGSVQKTIDSYQSDFQDLQEQRRLSKEFDEQSRYFRNEDKQAFNESRDFYQFQLQDIQSQMQSLRTEIADFESLRSSTDRTLGEVRQKLAEVESIRKDAKNKIAEFDNARQALTEASSVRYLLVERGDRDETGNEYRPCIIPLPFTNETLKAVFFDYKRCQSSTSWDSVKRERKEALVEITVESPEKGLRKIPFVLAEQIPQDIADTGYSLEATFVYLPPNPPLLRLPDFVMLKISMKPQKRISHLIRD